jgi:hypothetical protein
LRLAVFGCDRVIELALLRQGVSGLQLAVPQALESIDIP